MGKPATYAFVVCGITVFLFAAPLYVGLADFLLLTVLLYWRWFKKRPFVLPFKFPKHANLPDSHNPSPGKGGAGKSEGILYVGNLDEHEHPDHGRELWLTNADARTHMLFIGTTGSGKTEGLKSIVSNTLTWGSGFVYVDGKADTDLWASLYALSRRFGRDDDILVLNYMTANSDSGAVSNTMNPFSNGSASYLTNMITNLMPDAGGDNAMWKERAVALMGAMMPALTWKRDKEGLLLDVGKLREFIELPAVIRLSRDPNLPEQIIKGLQGYLNTLPGYVDAAFDDEGNERPPSPDQPMYDLQVARQQHGYLSMQFTRSLQSLADDYGYIFKVQLADIDVLDVVLNRRILVALIPALEKSGDEAANLGKIIAACLKGMMGATLGNTVEGSWENAIGSKQTRAASSFMTVFDEVGYYTAQGMAVMAAQARSLGFSLIFAAQDIPSMEKRVKQEAQSILANCNLKIFGKVEDPLDTKKFFQDHVGSSWVIESKGMTAHHNTLSSLFLHHPFSDDMGGSGPTVRGRADYDHLRTQREGEVHMFFNEWLVRARMFHAVADKVKALRVHKMLPVPGSNQQTSGRDRVMNEIASRFRDSDWTSDKASAPVLASPEIAALANLADTTNSGNIKPLEAAIHALAELKNIVPNARGMQPAGNMETGGGMPAATPLFVNVDPARAERKASLPPLLEGDEFVFEQLQAFPAGMPSVNPVQSMPPQQVAPAAIQAMPTQAAPASQEAAFGTGQRGYVPSDADLNLMVRPGVEVSAEDVLNTELPPEIASLLAQSADKLNKGLTGPDQVDAAE
jgi:intracellular multiplication protein IcmO